MPAAHTIQTYRGTWEEIVSHQDDFPVGAVLELRVLAPEGELAEAIGAVAPTISAKNAAAIAYLDRRLKEEATDDPEEIRLADEEVAELKRNMNANRAATGERLVFS